MSSTVYYGTATNPSGGAAIATSGSLSAGKYVVTASTQLTGTVAAGDLNNMQLQVGATVVGKLLTVIPVATGNQVNPPVTVDVPASTAVTVNAVGAASGVSAVYAAQIVATIA
jgi:hypothetical protein